MKTLKNNSIIALIFLAIFALSCGSSSDDVDCANTSALESSTEAYITAGFEYAGDQSSANCTALKTAAENYLSVIKDYTSCVPADQLDDWNTSIEQLETQIAGLNC